MKRAAIICAAGLAPFALTYLVCAFVELDLDAANWPQESRVLVAIFGILASILTTVIAFLETPSADNKQTADDLITRLRSKRERVQRVYGWVWLPDADCQRAADRIEELEREADNVSNLAKRAG